MEPPIHAIASRGVWDRGGTWHPIAYVDTHEAELLSRHKVLRFFETGSSSPKSVSTYSFPGATRASAFTTTLPSTPPTPRDSTLARRSLGEGGKLACYHTLAGESFQTPLSSRVPAHPLRAQAGHELDEEAPVDPLGFLARVLLHTPELNKHWVHFYGAYTNCIRSAYRTEREAPPDEAAKPAPPGRALKKALGRAPLPDLRSRPFDLSERPLADV